jgi:cyclopropane fatty-acyl-phospholipid synthase-like methyltransferase
MKVDQKELWQNTWKNITQHLPATHFAKRSYCLMSQSSKTLLDLGCGDGKDSLYFARKGFKVTAIDFSSLAIEKLSHRARAGMEVDAIVMDVRNIKFTGKFDVIYSNLGLHYFDDKTTTRIFQEIHQLLTKGGLFFVRCKSTNDPLYGQGKKLGKDFFILQNHKRHFFSKDYMCEKLANFKIIKVRRSTASHQRVEKILPAKSSFIEAVATKL